MLEELKISVLKANLDLKNHGLVMFTWGNVSAIDRDRGCVVIKPSGVRYEDMRTEDMVVVDLDGKVIEGALNPSTDLPTHLELYRRYPEIGGIAHTHSTYATAFAQAERAVPAYGTTHADYFHGDIPCAASPAEGEMGEYERSTGLAVCRAVTDATAIPACLVAHHGVFAWGKDAGEAVYHAAVTEEVARMAYLTEELSPDARRLPQYVSDKHYLRKHGASAYYGQKK